MVVRLIGPEFPTWGVRNAFLSVSAQGSTFQMGILVPTFGVGGRAVHREKGQTALPALAICQVSLIENNQYAILACLGAVCPELQKHSIFNEPLLCARHYGSCGNYNRCDRKSPCPYRILFKEGDTIKMRM